MLVGLQQMERPLHNFLSRLAKQTVKDFVIGNSSVDYDSFFGSIIFAYLLTSTTGRLHMPIIDCPQDEVSSRFQIKSVLDKVKLNINQLVFRQSPHMPYPLGSYNLYDHNHRSNLEHEIEYIVDHHQLKGTKGRKKLVSTMGSGLTMLYFLLESARMLQQEEYGFQAKYSEFVKDECFQHAKQKAIIDEEIKEIILYGILMDTFDLDINQRKRWTTFDKHAAQRIHSELVALKIDLWSYHLLLKKKNDIQESKKLTLRQQLGKDRKQEEYGLLKCTYSTILLSPIDFYTHYKMEQEFVKAASPSDIYFIMSVFENEKGELQRELIYRVEHTTDGNIIRQVLGLCLGGLGLLELGSLGQWRRWKDPSRTLSRKVVEPMVRKCCLELDASK